MVRTSATATNYDRSKNLVNKNRNKNIFPAGRFPDAAQHPKCCVLLTSFTTNIRQ